MKKPGWVIKILGPGEVAGQTEYGRFENFADARRFVVATKGWSVEGLAVGSGEIFRHPEGLVARGGRQSVWKPKRAVELPTAKVSKVSHA